MHIRKIDIEDIRCFGDGSRGVHLDLTRPDGTLAGWTVIAGRNGSGKSTLLRAVALALVGPLMARGAQASFAQWVRAGSAVGRVELDLTQGKDDPAPSPWAESPERKLGLSWKQERPGDDPNPEVPLRQWLWDENEEPRGFKFRGPWSATEKGWFLAAYGPYRRLGRPSDALPATSPRLDRIASLFDEERSLAEGIEWLKGIYSDRLDLESRAGNGQSARRAPGDERTVEALEQLQRSAFALLGDELLPDGARILDLNRDGLWIELHGAPLLLQHASDGYRTVLALVCDILRQMFLCFGELRVEPARRGGREIVTVPHEGVILIDEVESHLHVSWQRRIGFWLKEHFPNIQFLVSTHSPFVCQAADPGGLIRLAAPGEVRAAEHVPEDVYWKVVNGGADDAVLTELFGLETAYSEPAENLRRTIARLEARLVRGIASAAERDELASLMQRLPRTGSAMVEQELRKLGELR
jgi:energy-coupling factor transporter ATP-binding protein EcfA2